MAGQTGDTIIRLKRSSTVGNVPSGLTYGEAAVNIEDQKLWIGDSSGANVLLFAGPSAEQPAGQDGQLNYMFNGGFSASDNLSFFSDALGVTGTLGVTGNVIVTGGATFGGDINVNLLTIGRGGVRSSSNTVVGYLALNSNTTGGANIAYGHQALFSNTVGSNNVASGYQALYSNTEGGYNIATGNSALYSNTEGDGNVASGHRALYSNTGGDSNVATGNSALYYNTTGNFNIASGNSALYNNTEGNNNIATGFAALYSNTGGHGNIASGNSALKSNTTGDYNSAYGYQALYSNTEGTGNVASGYRALYYNTTGNFNIASGNQALNSNTEGNDNIAFGTQALYQNTEGDHNVAYGNSALKSNTGGDYNSALGLQAGFSILGSNNTAIGKDAGYDRDNDYTGSNNTYIGHNAQPSSVTASNEIVLGDSNVTLIHSAAGMSMGGGATFGGDVTIISAGDVALNLIADTDDSGENDNPIISMGQDGGEGVFELGVVGNAGQIFTNSTSNAGFLNTGSGWNDLQFSTNDTMRMTILRDGNVGIGTNAPAETLDVRGGITASGGLSVAGATFGGDVNFLGNILLPEDGEVGIGNDTENIVFNGGSGIIRLGANEIQIDRWLSHYGDNDTKMQFQTNQYTLAVGGVDIIDATPTGVHIPVGISADAGATFGGDVNVNTLTIGKGGGDVASNTAVGYQALYNNTEGDGNVASGYQALYNNTEGDGNVSTGWWALKANTEGDNNVASGTQALFKNTEGDGNVASGWNALRSNTTGNYNSASGTQALYSNTEGDDNVASGTQALYSNTGGSYNVASGYQALYNNTEGDDNVASGRQALYSNTGGDNNVASGFDAGRSILGSDNTAIGKDAGYDRYNDYTGSNNTYIGYNAQPSSPTVSNEIVLGDSNVVVVRTAAGISAGGGITCDNLNVGGYWAGEQSDYVGIAIDNGTSVITTGKKAHRIIPWDCEVVEWTISSADSGLIQWDINWCTYTDWPSTVSVGGSNLPAITLIANGKAQDTSVDWAKTTFAAGDIIEFEVDSVTSLTNCILSIKIRRTG